MKLRSRKRVPSPSLDGVEGANGESGRGGSVEDVPTYDSYYNCDDIAVEDFYYSSSDSYYQDDGGPNTDSDVIDSVKKADGKNASSRRKRQPKAGDKKRKRNDETRKELLWEKWEEDDQEWIDQNLSEEVDYENHNHLMNEVVEAPSELIMPLLRYQKEWLAWALKQENSEIRGGILADEMGMGKTIQAIALVLANLDTRICDTSPSFNEASSSLLDIKGTLVICPVVAVSQWVCEIDRFTSKGSLKVLVYHGAKREKSPAQFAGYDFVVTTYSIVESEYRRNIMPPKKQCPYCSKSFYEKKLKTHWRYFCGPDAMKTEKQSKQFKKSQPKSSKRKMEDELEHTGGIELNLSRRNSLLHAVKWNRIILDEAHYIKARHSNTAKAVFSLESSYRWALSGTPLQNRVGELYSLVRFLQIVPYSYYFCKDCDCRTLDHSVHYGIDGTPFYLENGANLSSPSSSSDCSNCGHSSVRHFCWWNRNVATPIQNDGSGISGRRAMILLTKKILKKIVLRRTKKGRAADLALPPRIISLRRDTLDIKEQDYYDSLYSESRAQFDTYVKADTLMNNYAHVFDLLTRLRQAVDHPYLVEYSQTKLLRRDTTFVDNGEHACGICHDPAEDPVVTSCEHVFCKSCLIDYSAALGRVSCPSCSTLLTVDLTSNKYAGTQASKPTIKGFRSSSILNRIQLENFQSSTKIEALREEIRFMVERDGSAKGIIFSQFTSFLDLINYSLQKSGISCVQLVGSMSLASRDAAIKRFSNDPECKIFLMSLKAGGVALNLTVSSHVFLMDPWWNPAVERQAQDRIHRIGQYKPIRIVRFVIENTIEERILKLQEKKELVFEGTIGGSSEALGKLTEADLRFLFN